MLRLAAKLVAFFWRRAEGLEEEAGPLGPELAEGASREGCEGCGSGWSRSRRGGREAAGDRPLSHDLGQRLLPQEPGPAPSLQGLGCGAVFRAFVCREMPA